MTRTLDSVGNLKVSVNARTLRLAFTIQTGATYTIDTNDSVIYGNRATPQTFTLPASSGTGRCYIIKQIGAGTLTLSALGSDLIDGQGTQIMGRYDSIMIQDGGTGTWYIL